MDLHKETGTEKFESIYHQSIVNVLFTYNWCNGRLKEVINPYHITAQQFNILKILNDQLPHPSTVNFLKARMLDKMCDASRIVDRLIQKELVIKSVSKADKRSVDIIISKKGIDLLSKISTEHTLSSIVSDHLNEQEAEQLNELLDKLRG
jgi:DNA-binding MarR family transcriptional regulator